MLNPARARAVRAAKAEMPSASAVTFLVRQWVRLIFSKRVMEEGP